MEKGKDGEGGGKLMPRDVEVGVKGAETNVTTKIMIIALVT